MEGITEYAVPAIMVTMYCINKFRLVFKKNTDE